MIFCIYSNISYSVLLELIYYFGGHCSKDIPFIIYSLRKYKIVCLDYYGWIKDSFVFGSELKIYKVFPYWENSINVNALSLFLRYNYIPAPYSIYDNIWKLPAGSYLKVSKNDLINHS